MVNVSLRGPKVIFEVAGLDKLWAFKSSLEIPVDHITDVYAKPGIGMGWFEGFKIIGTAIPNVFRAGTFYQEGEFVFWDVHNVQNAVVIELAHEHFAKLVIEVSEPEAVVNTLKKALYSRNE